jgi:hypothetical protein
MTRQKACEYCDDGDGFSAYPYYGVAPHICFYKLGRPIGGSELLPRDQWGNNFREDPECPGNGVYLRCPHCGAGEQAPLVETDKEKPSVEG